MTGFPCRGCGAAVHRVFADLGEQPLANGLVDPAAAGPEDARYPLRAHVCDSCLLVQLDALVGREALFSDDYAYLSSYSDSWVEHARRFVDEACARLGLGERHRVIEVASNDGYLLRHLVGRTQVLGIEPAANAAAVARGRGVPTETAFFGAGHARSLVSRGLAADLLVANNVLAHVPDLHDFVSGIRLALAPAGTATIEVPHLLRLLAEGQFETIYHEHYSYFSLHALRPILGSERLQVIDVERLPTHGGSLRLWVARDDDPRETSPAVGEVLADERAAGLDTIAAYEGFQSTIARRCAELTEFLDRARAERATVVGYGAAAKATTLLNTCGVAVREIPFVADRSEVKQGRLLPGSRIPVVPPERILETRPHYVVIFPWNIRSEIVAQLAPVRAWGGRFVVPLPRFEVLP